MNNLTLASTEEASDDTTGALKVNGGISTKSNIYVNKYISAHDVIVRNNAKIRNAFIDKLHVKDTLQTTDDAIIIKKDMIPENNIQTDIGTPNKLFNKIYTSFISSIKSFISHIKTNQIQIDDSVSLSASQITLGNLHIDNTTNTLSYGNQQIKNDKIETTNLSTNKLFNQYQHVIVTNNTNEIFIEKSVIILDIRTIISHKIFVKLQSRMGNNECMIVKFIIKANVKNNVLQLKWHDGTCIDVISSFDIAIFNDYVIYI